MRLYSVEDRKAPFIDAYVASATRFGFDVRLVAPNDDAHSGFDKFRTVYRHLSVNSVAFELACFRRYFEVLRMTTPGDRFVIADSDLIINTTERGLPACYIDMGDGLVGSIGISDGAVEDDISPHFSLWTRSLLQRFVDYLVASYESSAARMTSIYTQRLHRGNTRAAISDMTLLNLFVRDTGVTFVNSNSVDNGRFIDHNLSMREAVNETFRMEFGFKSLRSDRSGLLFVTSHGSPVRPAVLHLQGRAKIASYDLLARRYRLARGRLAMISVARRARKWVARRTHP